jgi:trehalose 6-phosphate phosphatase
VTDADATTATIAALTAHPRQTALLVDFDGSLAPIVDRAEDARPLPAAIAVLERLATRLRRVGVVSGRPVGYLVTHLPLPDAVYVGLYGMEQVVNGQRMVDPRVEPYLDGVARAVDELRTRLPANLIEPKSGVSVTVHWRPEPERAEEIRAIASVLARRYGLAQLRTRMAVELRPPVPVDKGDAVRTLIAGCRTGAFAGDDTGDLPAFSSLTDAVRAGTLERAVRIGVTSSEAPPELAAAVDILVDGPGGLVALLERVADEIV